MPLLIYRDKEGHQIERSFSEEISLGSDEERCDIVLPADAGVAPWHAVIIRSALTRVPMLVNLVGQDTWVNESPVVGIQVLRQRDVIRLGKSELSMWEVRITRLEPTSRLIGSSSACLVCSARFEAGDEIIRCPLCATPYHRNCWFTVTKCANHACVYSILISTLDALAKVVPFDVNLRDDSPYVEIKDDEGLVKQEGRRCAAGNKRDKIPFQAGNNVVLCPTVTCRTPYHLSCWLVLDKCTICGYNIRQLIDQTFSFSTEVVLEGGG